MMPLDVDELTIPVVESPDSEKYLCSVLADLHDQGQTVIPVGGGTHLFWGNPPRAADRAICLRRLDRIVAHEAQDLLVTVQAGCPFHALQRRLAAHNQWFPVDMPHDEGATIGGVVATGYYGPSRMRHGRIRDYLLGVRVVHADGTCTKAGGKVVKNVSGYDLSKLYAGSFGWLGVFTEFHLKTVPLSECEQTGWVRAGTIDGLRGLGQKVLDDGLLPSGFVLTRASWLWPDRHRDGDGFVLLIRFADHAETVHWQFDRVWGLAACHAEMEQEMIDEPRASQLWSAVSRMGVSDPDPQTLVLKIIVPYAHTAAWVDRITLRSESAGWSVRWFCYAGAHVLWVTLNPKEHHTVTAEEWAPWLQEARADLRSLRGELILVRGPRALKERFEVWGVVGKPLEIMHGIKRKLDPKGILNPGRFVGRF